MSAASWSISSLSRKRNDRLQGTAARIPFSLLFYLCRNFGIFLSKILQIPRWYLTLRAHYCIINVALCELPLPFGGWEGNKCQK